MVDHLDNRDKEPLCRRIKSESTSAYCKGRRRLPLSGLQGALSYTGRFIQQLLGAKGLWLGHPGGSTGWHHPLAPARAGTVQHYGRHKGRFCLYTAALLSVAEGSLHLSEQAASLPAQAIQGSVYIGDRNFGIFSVAQAARHYSVWVVLRLTRQRLVPWPDASYSAVRICG